MNTPADLSQMKCIPCQIGMPPLPPAEIVKRMGQVSDWSLQDGKLVRDFKFKDFKEAINFINKVAELAENEGHHPDISLYNWNRVKLVLFTHKITGLHENDFILAAKVNQITL